MPTVTICISNQQWMDFVTTFKIVQYLLQETKRTSIQLQMLQQSLESLKTLKPRIQQAFLEWETLEKEGLPPIEQKISTLQENANQLILTLQSIK